jgi:hypothetical protein
MNIKNISLATAFAAFAAVSASAQSVEFVDRGKPDHLVEVGLHIGDGVSTILQNYAKQVPGLAEFNIAPCNMNTFGASVELPFRNYLSLGTGLDFTISNYHWSMTLLDASSNTLNSLYTNNHFYAVNVPVFISPRFNLGENVMWTSEIGGYMSFAVGNGTSKTHAYASSTNSLGQSQVTEMLYERKYFKDDEPIINGVTTTDYGLHLATGMRFYKHFSLKAVFQVGVRNLAINYGVLDITNRNISLAFKAGYIF